MKHGWIVNEDGINIEITNGVGTDGCFYELSSNSTSVERISDPDDPNRWVTGEFDLHITPYFMGE